MLTIRLATPDDVPALAALIDASVRQLSVGHLTPQQVEAELRWVITPDTRMIADGTLWVAEAPDGAIVGMGGWSARAALHGGDAYKAAQAGPDPDGVLDPASDAARIRQMFTHPAWARRGIARMIFERARAAAEEAGFRRLVLTATMLGVPLYRALGFAVDREYLDRLPDGVEIPVAEMSRGVRVAGEGAGEAPGGAVELGEGGG